MQKLIMQKSIWATVVLAVAACFLPGGRYSAADDAPSGPGPGHVQTAATDTKLYLHYAAFDPLRELPPVPPRLAAPKTSRLYVIQLAAVPDDRSRGFLLRQGAQLWRYLPENAYLAEVDPARVPGIRASAFVRWAGPYEPAYKVEPALEAATLQGDTPPDGAVPCVVQAVRKGRWSLRAVADLIRRAGGAVWLEPREGYRLVAALTPGQLCRAAASDDVCYVERVNPQWLQSMGGTAGGGDAPAPAITMQTVRDMCGANYVERVAGYDGRGVRGSVIDGYVRYDHADLAARPVLFAGPRVSTGAFHGTAVTGILFGTGASDPRARGLLPGGQAIFTCDRPVYSVRGPHVSLYGLTRRLLRPPYRAVFESSSTGGGYADTYDTLTAEMDDVVLEDDMLVCQALGNSGGRTQESPGWAKNVVSVGGVDHADTATKADDHWARGASCGPTDDLRIKPDLVQFCTGVYCAGAATRRDHETFLGTSAAAPLTAGHFGLMYQMWADGLFGNPVRGKTVTGKTVFDRRPHAATAKALMINTASPYEFTGDDPGLGRDKQGWGLADVGNLYDLRHKFFIVDQSAPLGDHQARAYSLHIAPGEPSLRATLAYTDVPGAACAARFLVNSLVLRVTSPDGVVYYGNGGLDTGNWSAPGGGADTNNNVQNVFIRRPTGGVWRVEVYAYRIAMDQHRGTGAWDQDFALVVSGVAPGPPGKPLP